MARVKINIILLCEDSQQEAFFRRFLKKRGYVGREIRTEKAPRGVGSGEQYVRESYAKEVYLLRSRNYITSKGLLVAIDVDIETVEYRHQQLDSALTSSRQPNERIFIATPKRNIETWIHFLNGETVDEQTAYIKAPGRERKCKPAAEKLSEILHCLPNGTPDSLVKSAVELRRIP